jgi:hypothetical protein
VDFPDQASSAPIRRDDEAVAAVIRLGLPISDHSELEPADLYVVQYRETVIHRSSFGAS